MIFRGWSVPAMGGVAGLVCVLPAAALGQMSTVIPYYAVVTTEDASLRCGSSDSVGLLNSMYSVGKLQRGQLVRVDAEGGGWARAVYPAGTYVFVPSDSAQLDPTTKFVTLTKAIRPKAANVNLGLKGSWKDAIEQPLPVGARLDLAEAEAAVDGRGNTAFKVIPPESARAFVPVASLRRASDEEVSTFLAGAAPAPLAPLPALAAAPQPTDLTQPMTPPSPGAAPVSAPVPTTAQGPEPAATPAQPVEIKAVEVRAVEVKPSPYEKLEAAFEAVRNQPPDAAEFGELLSEFQAAAEKVDPKDPAARMIRARLQQRIEFLRLRADMQAKQREFAAASESVAGYEKLLAEKLGEVDRVRQYTIVGRLTASTIYNGTRLPLMYRVQAVGGPSPRTLAYVKPDEELKVDSKLGLVVGVIGDAKMDPTLKLNIITPLRIDILEAAGETEPTREAAAPQKPD